MRTARNDSKKHSSYSDINAKPRTAIDFTRYINARNRFTNESEVARRFQSYAIRIDLRELCRCFDQFAIRNTASARTVHHRAILGAALLLINSPPQGRRNEKHLARLRPNLAHVFPCSSLCHRCRRSSDSCRSQESQAPVPRGWWTSRPLFHPRASSCPRFADLGPFPVFP